MNVVDTLRAALRLAEAGELSGVALATCHTDLSTGSAWAMEDATLAELLGSSMIMQARLVREAEDCSNS